MEVGIVPSMSLLRRLSGAAELNDGDVVALDPVLPDQAQTQRRVAEGEHLLMIAVLQDAIECARGRGRVERQGVARNATITRQRLRREAGEWFASTDQSHIFSFEVICQHLKLDPTWARRKVEAGEAKAVHQRVVHAAVRVEPDDERLAS